MITPERAMATYHAGPEAVVRMICDLSSHGDLLQKRVEELEIKVAKLLGLQCHRAVLNRPSDPRPQVHDGGA